MYDNSNYAYKVVAIVLNSFKANSIFAFVIHYFIDNKCMQYGTPQHDQNTAAPCDMSFICNFTCSQGLHRIMASFLSGLHAIEQAQCTGIQNFPIGPFYMSHKCKLFNPGAGKLTALH